MTTRQPLPKYSIFSFKNAGNKKLINMHENSFVSSSKTRFSKEKIRSDRKKNWKSLKMHWIIIICQFCPLDRLHRGVTLVLVSVKILFCPFNLHIQWKPRTMCYLICRFRVFNWCYSMGFDIQSDIP